jgi:hypothetical protein
VEELTRWFSFIGKKVLDTSIDPDEILKGTLKPKSLGVRPAKVPVRIDWPVDVYSASETDLVFDFGDGSQIPLYSLDIELKDPSASGNIEFSVSSDFQSVDFSLVLKIVGGNNVYEVNKIGRGIPNIHIGKKVIPASSFFNEKPPTIWFSDGAALEGNTYTELNSNPSSFPDSKIDVWDWSGINIRKESQGVTKDADSIQFKVIKELKTQDFEVIINDDGKGEVADVVAIRVVEPGDGRNYIEANLYHCKFSSANTAGGRIKDLYEVCGQAQRSAHWKENPYKLFSHFLRREPLRRSGREYSRFEKGTKTEMEKIIRMSDIYDLRLNIFIVQPGVSIAQITAEQRKLLAVTENYLSETFELPFRAIIAP